MTFDRSVRAARAAIALATLAVAARPAAAQEQPQTIPVVVAQATNFMTPFGPTRFFDARLPDGWPADLVPEGARLLGGSSTGEPSSFHMRVAVFDFPAAIDPDAAAADLVQRAGYVGRHSELAPARGGFVATERMESGGHRCKGDAMVTFGPVDTVRAPRVRALVLLTGDVGRHNCAGGGVAADPTDLDRGLPPLPLPAGVTQTGGGSSWGGDGGSVRTELVTTMSVDSVLAHYAARLTAAGWSAEGRPTVGDGAGVQRFAFRRDDEEWIGALFVVATPGRRELTLQMARKE